MTAENNCNLCERLSEALQNMTRDYLSASRQLRHARREIATLQARLANAEREKERYRTAAQYHLARADTLQERILQLEITRREGVDRAWHVLESENAELTERARLLENALQAARHNWRQEYEAKNRAESTLLRIDFAALVNRPSLA